jgi:two-component system, sensor histidine kinase and response regulator
MLSPVLAIEFQSAEKDPQSVEVPSPLKTSVAADQRPEQPRVNILLVDDTPENLVALEAVLSSLGQNVVKARSGEEALRLLLRQEFAVILLDVNMPGLNGFETAEMIRQRKSTEHIPIIFVSAVSTSDTHLFKGYALGAVDYIFTPVIPEVLRSKVTVFVELLKKTDEARKLNADLERRANQLQAANAELEAEIATRKRAEAALQDSNSALEAFSYSVSHDLRAPIRAMQGFAKVLLEDYGLTLDELGKECAGRIVHAAQRMDCLVEDLLVYSRLGHTTLELEPVGLEEIISEARAQLEQDFAAKKAIVDVQHPLPIVLAHKTTLVQVATNLMANGVKFVPNEIQPHLRVSAEVRGDFATLWFEDNGIGIAPENHSRIFRVFERLHGADDYPGTGLGLAIVRKGVERMGGQVGLESGIGAGSRFWIRLCLSVPGS